MMVFLSRLRSLYETNFPTMKPVVAPVLWLLLAICPLDAATTALQQFSGATLSPTEWADGDSFLVRFSDPSTGKVREEVFRLYGVDCVEVVSTHETDRRRLLEQARHFGVEDPAALIPQGRMARDFMIRRLQKPFVVHTAFSQAMGRSGNLRYYAFVITAEGHDLAAELVSAGLARVKGISRETPDGTTRAEYEAHLSDLEVAAAMEWKGVWKLSNPSRLAELRAVKRKEEQMLSVIRETPTVSAPLNINVASLDELKQLPGIGSVLARRILEGRPYHSLDDLLRVQGISKTTLEKLRPYLQEGGPLSNPTFPLQSESHSK